MGNEMSNSNNLDAKLDKLNSCISVDNRDFFWMINLSTFPFLCLLLTIFSSHFQNHLVPCIRAESDELFSKICWNYFVQRKIRIFKTGSLIVCTGMEFHIWHYNFIENFFHLGQCVFERNLKLILLYLMFFNQEVIN